VPIPDLLSQTDHCVLCGLCSQHCPTYALNQDENESPRGRISLIAALSQGQITADEHVQAHLEHCLLCRACERHCPSGVAFGAIMDEARARFVTHKNSPPLLSLLAKPEKLKRMGRWLNLAQYSGLRYVARTSGLTEKLGLREADRLLTKAESPHWKTYYPSQRAHLGDVALFTGCISQAFDSNALKASIEVLTRLGYGAHVPSAQSCCGALHQHNGNPEEALPLVQQNLNAFGSLDVLAIVHTASGCTAMLKEYPTLPRLGEATEPAAQHFANKVMDMSQFLSQCQWPHEISLKPLPQRVAVHDPCTLRNVLCQADQPYRLLERIPDLELVSLPANDRCCGAAGTFMLTQPEIAAQLLSPKLDSLDRLNIKTVVTSNIGCALHLKAGLKNRGMSVEVLHPITLLARQIRAL
jgi:glycolate oxidase iron-sulfur subunit